MDQLSFWERIARIISDSGSAILQGCLYTAVLAVVGTLFGCLIGFAVGIVQATPVSKSDSLFKRISLKIVNFILSAYVEIFRGTPMIVQAMVVYYGALQYLNLDIPALTAALLVVSVNTGAYMAEIVRGGILSVPAGQREAATAVGMSHWQMMTSVILPQAIRNILPSMMFLDDRIEKSVV